MSTFIESMPRKVSWSTRYDTPDRMLMYCNNIDSKEARKAADYAVACASKLAPRLSASMSGRFQAIYGDGYFGIRWLDQYAWFQEVGIRPFTMTRLQKKTIPLWITDYSGLLRRENPKSQTRVTADGRVQVLIFRRAAKIGQRKKMKRERYGQTVTVDVPASYPGAPGRIVRRVPPRPTTPSGMVGGWIARSNIGVRWRHPGLDYRGFIQQSILMAAAEHGLTGHIRTLRP